LVHHPSVEGSPVHTVVFLPGGDGRRPLAMATWDLWLSSPSSPDTMRVVVPYSASGDLSAEAERALAILDEVLACYGGDPEKVHLGGSSMGGLAAFDLMLDHHERFATLLGAPGAWERGVTSEAIASVRGKAVFNGIGELDSEPWTSEARDIDSRLEEEGIDTRLVVFGGEGHILSPEFDETVFYEFWSAH
jgi:pimeloyl-ACP methyl ester carboxylesterase